MSLIISDGQVGPNKLLGLHLPHSGQAIPLIYTCFWATLSHNFWKPEIARFRKELVYFFGDHIQSFVFWCIYLHFESIY